MKARHKTTMLLILFTSKQQCQPPLIHPQTPQLSWYGTIINNIRTVGLYGSLSKMALSGQDMLKNWEKEGLEGVEG